MVDNVKVGSHSIQSFSLGPLQFLHVLLQSIKIILEFLYFPKGFPHVPSVPGSLLLVQAEHFVGDKHTVHSLGQVLQVTFKPSS